MDNETKNRIRRLSTEVALMISCIPQDDPVKWMMARDALVSAISSEDYEKVAAQIQIVSESPDELITTTIKDLKCKNCGIGIDDDGDGDCAFCAKA